MLVVGALTLLGSRAAVHLAGRGWVVVGVARAVSPEPLLWYRWGQLRAAGVEVGLTNASSRSEAEARVRDLQPAHLILVPPGLEAGSPPPAPSEWGQVLEGAVLLLEAVRTLSPCTHVLLVSQSECEGRTPVATAHWLDSLELTLATAHRLYGTAVSVLRSTAVYGPWGRHALQGATPQDHHWYVGDVTMAMENALGLSFGCQVLDIGPRPNTSAPPPHRRAWHLLRLPAPVPVPRGAQLSSAWARAYTRQAEGAGQAVVLTSYFTSARDSQRNVSVAPDRFQYMSEWLLSVRALGLRAVVFHDGMAARFQHRLSRLHPSLGLRRVRSLAGRSTNDARFFAYLAFLHARPEIRHVLLTDVADVRLQRSPFQLMALLGDWLYVGTDTDFFPSMRSMGWLRPRLEACLRPSGLLAPLSQLLDLDSVYNAGVIGGSRHVVLTALTLITHYLAATPPTRNCNMPVVNFALHRHLYERIFTGFPLTSRFLRQQTLPRGVYIVHK